VAPRHARLFVALFVATLVVCALVPLNAWPFSSWELFSRLRADRQTGWEEVAVGPHGRERADPIAPHPPKYRGFASIISGFPERSLAQRDALCAVWFQHAVLQFGPRTRVVRIYHLDWLLSNRRGGRAAPPHRRLMWTCSAEGVRAG
jgi:hypothetical protein